VPQVQVALLEPAPKDWLGHRIRRPDERLTPIPEPRLWAVFVCRATGGSWARSGLPRRDLALWPKRRRFLAGHQIKGSSANAQRFATGLWFFSESHAHAS
jgi:hypothetical protein